MSTPTMVTIVGNVAPLGDVKKLVFRIPTILYSVPSADVIVPNDDFTVVPDDSGHFSIALYGTNDPAWSPSNWTYLMRAVGDDVVVEYPVSVPYDLPSPSNFSLILPALPASDGVLYASYNHTHSGGGGGGGASPATSVTDETAFGVAKAVGTSTNYARQDHTHGTPTAPTAASVGADVSGAATTAVAGHVAAGNPHAQYQLTSTLTESVQDIVGAFLVQGTNVTLNYDDTANTLTINASGGGGSADGNAVFPLSHWGLVAASDDPLNFYGKSQVNGQVWHTRIWVPANTPITGLYAAVTDAGTHDGTTNGNGLALYSDAGALIDQVPFSNTLWSSNGWRGGNLSAGQIAGQASGRWVYVASMFRGYGTLNPSIAFPSSAADTPFQYTGPGTTKRRTFYTGATGTFPSTIDPTSTGSATGYTPLFAIA